MKHWWYVQQNLDNIQPWYDAANSVHGECVVGKGHLQEET